MTKRSSRNDHDDATRTSRTGGKVSRAETRTEQRTQTTSGGARTESAQALDNPVLEILGDQTRHAIEATLALGRARNFTEALQVQSDFIGESFGRLGRMNECYLTLLRPGALSVSSTSRH